MKKLLFLNLAVFCIVTGLYAGYNPNAGRFLNRDPKNEKGFQLITGIKPVTQTYDPEYVFVCNNPFLSWDYLGLYTITEALFKQFQSKNPGYTENAKWKRKYGQWIYTLSEQDKFNIWVQVEKSDTLWLNVLPKKAPPCLEKSNGKYVVPKRYQKKWGTKVTTITNPEKFHPGGAWEIRSPKQANGAGHQAIYDKKGILMMNIPSAGTADRYSGVIGSLINHYYHDVQTYNLAKKLNRIKDYYSVRPMPAKGD